MRKNDDPKGKQAGLLKNILTGCITGFAFSVVILGINAIFVASGKVPENLMVLMTCASVFAGALIGAFIAIRKSCTRILLTGFSVGILMFLLTLLIGAITSEKIVGPDTLKICLALLAGSLTASLLGARKKTRRF